VSRVVRNITGNNLGRLVLAAFQGLVLGVGLEPGESGVDAVESSGASSKSSASALFLRCAAREPCFILRAQLAQLQVDPQHDAIAAHGVAQLHVAVQPAQLLRSLQTRRRS